MFVPVLLFVITIFSPHQSEISMPSYSRSGYDITPLTQEQLQPLLEELSEETLRITQKGALNCMNILNKGRNQVLKWVSSPFSISMLFKRI